MNPASLVEIATQLRTGELDLLTYLNQLCDLIDASEPQIQALLPEAGRRMRLLHEAKELQMRFPDPTRRPALFGIPVAVKDIFRVDGFPTHAGSQLPVELFIGPESDCVRTLRSDGALRRERTRTIARRQMSGELANGGQALVLPEKGPRGEERRGATCSIEQ